MSIRFHQLLQPEPGLCLATCCAMLAGCSVDEVVLEQPPHKPEVGPRYLPTHKAVQFLAKRMIGYGLVVGKIANLEESTKEFQVSLSLDFWAILTVPSGNYEDCLHAVVWNPVERFIYDPCHVSPRNLTDYPEIVEWCPVYNIEEVSATFIGVRKT